MALTIDILKANSVLAGLTQEQIDAIVTLSVNDENTVIGKKVGEIHGQYDIDVESTVGVPKKQGEKSYDYVKRVLNDFKTKMASLNDLNTKITTLTSEKEALEAKIKEGSGDAVLKQQLTDANTKLIQLQQMYDTDKATFEANKAKYDSDIQNLHVNHAIDTALTGLKFKATIPESAQKILISTAKAEILTAYKPEFITDQLGNKTLVYRDQNGNLMNNPQNALNPFTTQELISNKLKDVLDFGVQKPGTGTRVPNVAPIVSANIDLTGVKTQVEADKAIETHLMAQGFTRDSADFATKSIEIRNELEVAKLPIQ